MPTFELTQDAVSEIPVILTDTAGAPVPAVVKGSIDPYYKKSGGSFTQLPAADFDWDEEDATNAPGHYTLTINSTGVGNNRLDTLGDFILVIKEVSGTFVQHPAYCYVTTLPSWDILRRIRSWRGVNYRFTPATWDSTTGEAKTGTMKIYPTSADCEADTNAIESGSLDVTYDAQGRVTLYKSKV